MDPFELFDTDRADRRDRRPELEEPRSKGLRGFFQRWMAAVGDDDDDRRRRDAGSGRRDSDRDWD